MLSPNINIHGNGRGDANSLLINKPLDFSESSSPSVSSPKSIRCKDSLVPSAFSSENAEIKKNSTNSAICTITAPLENDVDTESCSKAATVASVVKIANVKEEKYQTQEEQHSNTDSSKIANVVNVANVAKIANVKKQAQEEQHEIKFKVSQLVTPGTAKQALKSPQRVKWTKSMMDEITELELNETWEFVTLRWATEVHPNCTPIKTKWVYRIKEDS